MVELIALGLTTSRRVAVRWAPGPTSATAEKEDPGDRRDDVLNSGCRLARGMMKGL